MSGQTIGQTIRQSEHRILNSNSVYTYLIIIHTDGESTRLDTVMVMVVELRETTNFVGVPPTSGY